jgi:cytochrome c556
MEIPMSSHRKIPPLIAVLCLLIAASLPACTPAGDETEQAPPTIAASHGDIAAIDDRLPISVDAATRYAVLKEMRTMLNAVQGIVGGAARGDTAAMRASATSAGMMAASEAGENVAAQLGAQFVQLGMLTHVTFDSLALDVTQGKSREAVLRRLSTVMGNCVGCHNQFRLVVQP